MGAGPAARPPAAAPAPAARPPAAMIVDSQDESLELFEEGGFDGDFAMSFSTDEPAESTAMEAPPPSSPATGHRPPRRSGR
jgi:hypothetical protein